MTTRLITALSLVALLAGCTVHHHHHYGSDEAPRERQAAEPTTQAPPPAQSPSQAPPPPSQPAPEPVVSQEGSHSAAVFQGCDVKSYPSGWIEAFCGPITYLVMTGPAAQRHDEMLYGLTSEHASRFLGSSSNVRWSHEEAGTVRTRAGTFALRSVTYETRPPEELGAFFFAPEPPGEEIHVEALQMLAPTSRGPSAMICFQHDQLDEDECLTTFDELTHYDLGDLGAEPAHLPVVADVPMDFRETCHYNQPEVLVCQLNGALRWRRGTTAEARQFHADQLHFSTYNHGNEEFYNPVQEFDCQIGGKPGRCHEIEYQGVLSTPSRIVYMADVRASDGHYAFFCSVNVDEDMNEPCRLIFGGQTTGRYH